MNEIELRDVIEESLCEYYEDEDFRLMNFEEAMVLTKDEGLVLKFKSGDEFQITIDQSKRAVLTERKSK